MSHKVDTAFDRTFSEPPQVSVSGARTHCEACKEPLEPSVMHKCHGNKHYEPLVVSSTQITEACPACGGQGVLVENASPHTPSGTAAVVVCKDCRTYLYSPFEIQSLQVAIALWNGQAMTSKGPWPKWLADLPGEDERKRTAPRPEEKGGHPDLTAYKGSCPRCMREGNPDFNPECELCGGKGVIE